MRVLALRRCLTIIALTIICLSVSCFPFTIPAPVRAASSHLVVWVVSDGDKMLRDAAPLASSCVWSQASGRVSLRAARNEYIALQVMATASGADLHGVNASMGALDGIGGTAGSIPADGVELFREHYLEVTEPSSAMYGEQSTTGHGWYPDPLVPADAPDGGLPCDVSSGLNQGIWVDVYVPGGASPGNYSGTLRVSATGEPDVVLPVDLEVWAFALPEESHLPSFFMYQPNQLADAHGVGKYSDEYLAIEAEYARMARAHRMNISTSVYPEVNGTGVATTVVWDSWHDQFASRHLDGTIYPDGRGECLYALPIGRDNPDPAEHGGLGSAEFEATFTAMLTQFRDHFEEKGWFDRSFLYIVDEPNSAEAYDLVRYYGDLIDRTGAGFPFMVTEGPVPQDTGWGSLAGYVDIWCCGGTAWPGPMQARQALGEQAWTYNGGEPYAGSQVIDTPGTAMRTWGWITRRYGVQCWLLWDVCYFHDLYNGCDYQRRLERPFELRPAPLRRGRVARLGQRRRHPLLPRHAAGHRRAGGLGAHEELAARGPGLRVPLAAGPAGAGGAGGSADRRDDPGRLRGCRGSGPLRGATTPRRGRRPACRWARRCRATGTTPAVTTSPRATPATASRSTSAWATRVPARRAPSSTTSSPTGPASRSRSRCRAGRGPPWTSTPSWGRGATSPAWSMPTQTSGWRGLCISPTARVGRAATTSGGRVRPRGSGTSRRATPASGFDQWVCVLEPGDTAASLTFRFQTEEEDEVARDGGSVAAHSRRTYKVNDLLGPGYQNSLALEASAPVVAERPIYFDYDGTGGFGWDGGHCVMGASATSREFFFAEGTTREGFEEWLTLQNPGADAITVEAEYQLGPDQGGPVSRSYTVEGRSALHRAGGRRGGGGEGRLGAVDVRLRLPGRAAHVLRLPRLRRRR